MTHDRESNDGSNAKRAYAVFRRAALELETTGSLTVQQMTARLRTVSEHVLDLLGRDEDDSDPSVEDTISSLEQQSRDIADDLRRVERLMKHQPPDDD